MGKFIIVIAIIITLLIIYVFYKDSKEWEIFAKEHDCHKVEIMPSQTAYKCDDGIIYWR